MIFRITGLFYLIGGSVLAALAVLMATCISPDAPQGAKNTIWGFCLICIAVSLWTLRNSYRIFWLFGKSKEVK